MIKINLLDQNTIDKIAAGEVVDRPSSVVKELCENAIDAGATMITAELKSGGTRLIRITDNGCGIAKEDVKDAFLRHSTSKLSSIEDLLTIGTLGFRGEALSSISAVSKVTLLTKTKESLVGVRYIIDGGNETAFEDAGVPDGTTIMVENIFQNVPARLKFLKSARTEESACKNIFDSLAMSHPHIAFRLICDGRTLLNTPGSGKLIDILYSLYGKDVTGHLLRIDKTDGDMSVSGYVGDPGSCRGNRQYEIFFVNGRYVNCNTISKAAEEAFKPYLMNHQFPVAVLFLNLPGDRVDVNVHPAKAEVRFTDEKYVYDFAKDAVLDILSHRELIPKLTAEDKKLPPGFAASYVTEDNAADEPASKPYAEPLSQKAPYEDLAYSIAETSAPIIESDITVSAPESPEVTPYFMPRENKRDIEKQISAGEFFGRDKDENPDKDEPSVESYFKPQIRVIGCVFDTYWLIEYDGKFYMCDQHAAHEKVNYERFLKRFRERSFDAQRIMPPMIVTLSNDEKNLVDNALDLFNDFGFEIAPFGENEYAIYTVPADAYGMDGKTFFTALLDEFGDKIRLDTEPDLILQKLATAACKASVKGGDKISYSDAVALLNDLFALENPYNCPHGRPTMISFEKTEIEKMFKRIVS